MLGLSGSNIICDRLISPAEIISNGAGWHKDTYRDLKFRLDKDTNFPCVFSKNAFKKELLKFIFVEDYDEFNIQHLVDGLVEYVEISNRWSGCLDTAYPLLVVFSLDAIRADSAVEYHAFGWNVLQELHRRDVCSWPESVSDDPSSETWSMCFSGMPIFCNMSNPGHKVRRSRNLGKRFILVINPRDRFDVFAGDNPAGRKIREKIRDRIQEYDGVSHSAQLGSYGAGGLEWWQYGISEDNTPRVDKCPFRHLK